MLDRYEFERELASAARGAVFRARDRHTGRAVAIKLTPDSSAPHDCRPGPDAGNVASPLSHAARVRERGRDGNVAYVVTDFAPGRDLTAHTLPSRLLPLASTIAIVSQVSAALQYAHRRGVVHGDVKPANIVFDAGSGAAALIDFDVEEGRSSLTPAYASPERLCGGPASAASDQFALGVTLYQLCCGALPFAGRSRAEIAQRVVSEAHTDIRAHRADVPKGLARIIDRTLVKAPSGRYPSLAGLRRALSNYARAQAA